MEFRSYADLSRLLQDNLSRIPADVDLIAALPRSGTIPACMLALALNLPTTDLDALEAQLPIVTGQTRRFRQFSESLAAYRHVLVVDDTVHTGRNFTDARQRVAALGLKMKVTYAAVYASPEGVRHVDFHFEQCPFPRVFEWNYLHQATLSEACIDIDGVLCLDPTNEQNDDGPLYREFLRCAKPRFRPETRVYHLVTNRLEKYRAETEDWLQANKVQFEKLSMLDLPSAAERRRLRAHAIFKGEVYRADHRAEVFVESEVRQAPVIAALAGKPVICIGDQRYYPAPGERLPHALSLSPLRPARRLLRGVRRRLLPPGSRPSRG